MRFTDYESLGTVNFAGHTPPVLEAFRGSDIVDWYGRIEQSLINLLNDAEKANNHTYAERLRAYLETWREFPIDGSLNRETIDVLIAATKQWARESWDLQSYFLSLQTRLRQLVASEEELPRDIDLSQNEPAMGGGRGGGGGMPPMSPSFGPESEAPEGMGGGEAPEGMGGPEDMGGPGGEAPEGMGEAPGEEGGGEEAPEGMGGPEEEESIVSV